MLLWHLLVNFTVQKLSLDFLIALFMDCNKIVGPQLYVCCVFAYNTGYSVDSQQNNKKTYGLVDFNLPIAHAACHTSSVNNFLRHPEAGQTKKYRNMQTNIHNISNVGYRSTGTE